MSLSRRRGDWYKTTPPHIQETAFRNATLQGGYFIIAARALGLDCGPMSGFDNAKVDAEFFADGQLEIELPVHSRHRGSQQDTAAQSAVRVWGGVPSYLRALTLRSSTSALAEVSVSKGDCVRRAGKEDDVKTI